MTMMEHLTQPQINGPSKQTIGPSASRQSILDSVCQMRCIPHRFKFMTMNPLGEWPTYLAVLKEAILFVGSMQRDPVERTDAKFDAGAGLQATGFSDYADGWECGAQ